MDFGEFIINIAKILIVFGIVCLIGWCLIKIDQGEWELPKIDLKETNGGIRREFDKYLKVY